MAGLRPFCLWTNFNRNDGLVATAEDVMLVEKDGNTRYQTLLIGAVDE